MKTLKGQVTLLGNMGKRPIIHADKDGTKIASFAISTFENQRIEEGKMCYNKKWYQVECKGLVAEFLEYYGTQGCKMMVHGKKIKRWFTNKQGQKKVYELVEASIIKGL